MVFAVLAWDISDAENSIVGELVSAVGDRHRLDLHPWGLDKGDRQGLSAELAWRRHRDRVLRW